MRRILHAVWIVALSAGSVRADLTYQGPPGPLNMSVPCTHGTRGWTRIESPVWTSASDLAKEYPDPNLTWLWRNQFPGNWEYTVGVADAIQGTVAVTRYDPRDSAATCEHGASMVVSIRDLSLATPHQEFQWLQDYSYTTNVQGNGWKASHVLDPPVGYSAFPVDTLPFYYNIGMSNWSMPGDNEFGDGPGTFIDDSTIPHSGAWHFETFVASWNGVYDPDAHNQNVVTIYGRLEWGYSFECVPAPGAVILAILGLVLVGWLRRLQT